MLPQRDRGAHNKRYLTDPVETAERSQTDDHHMPTIASHCDFQPIRLLVFFLSHFLYLLPGSLYSMDIDVFSFDFIQFWFWSVSGELRKSLLWTAEIRNCRMLGHRSL